MTIREEVDALNDGLSRDLASQDTDGLVARYTDDAQLLLPGQPLLRGRQAVESTMRAWVGDGPVALPFESREVMTGGSLMVDVGEIIGPNGPSTKYVLVYQRQPDGSLRIAIDSASGIGESQTAE